MTRKQELELEKENLVTRLKQIKDELDFLNSSPAEQIRKILETNERRINIIEIEEITKECILVICDPTVSDFSYSKDALRNIGYTIEAFRFTPNNLRVWFGKIN